MIKFTINQSTVLEKIYFQKTESTEDLLNNEDDAHAYREQGNTKLKNVNIYRKGFWGKIRKHIHILVKEQLIA